MFHTILYMQNNTNKRKRTYSDNFTDSATKISADDKIFDYLYYLELIDKMHDDTYDEYKLFKDKALDIHYRENNIVRLQDDSYIEGSSYKNIKIQLDGFDDDGNLIYIIPFTHNINEIKINNLSKHHVDYIQIILNILKIDKCIVHVYSFEIHSNARSIRRKHFNINKNHTGWIINGDEDIYYLLQHVRKNVINKTKFNMRKISTINGRIMDINVKKYTTPDHKRKRNEYLDTSWIPASKTRNASLNDHLVDYCRVYNVKDIDDDPEKRSFNFDPSSKYERKNKLPHEANNFIDFLLTSGNFFEDKVIEKIQTKYPDKFVKVCDSFDARNIDNYKRTLFHMNKGVPIIHQAILYNYEHKVFGSADLLVRSDWINKLVKTKVLTAKEIRKKAPKLDMKRYHYRVIDIKFHKCHLNSDGKTLRNNTNVKPFKNQIAIYNMALGEMQGYVPSQSYILGKGWVMNKTVNKQKITTKSDDPFDQLGIIDFDAKDGMYNDQSLEHVNWLKELDASENWTHDPPTNNKLYPNMCVSDSGIYNKFKKQMAKKYKPVSQICNCSYSNQLIGFEKDIMTWNDQKCNSKILGINGKIKAPYIDEMIKFHRDSDSLISVAKINSNIGNWRNKNKIDFFVDFETINSTLLNSHYKTKIGNNDDYIFMIGVGWQTPKDEKWNFKCLYTKDISFAEETRIIKEMNTTISTLGKKHGMGNVYHWSKAEPIVYNKANRRYGEIFNKIKWFDLLEYFRNNKIFIREAYNFGLKSIATQMNKFGMIESNWTELDCTNGLDAMYYAWKIYVNKDNNEIFNDNTYQDIIKYNEIDCKTLQEILNYFRKNH